MLRTILYALLYLSILPARADVFYHFSDTESHALKELEFIWSGLYIFYENMTPLKIILNKKDFLDGTSRFNCKTNSIFINPKTFENGTSLTPIAHESSHLALCNLTNGVNILEKSRFWDEGFANIMQQRINGDIEAYKKKSLAIAFDQLQKDNVTFEKVRDWKRYSRDDAGKINNFSYAVGSSFDFYVMETFGEKKLKKFFIDIGITKDFNKTISNVFLISPSEFELGWKEYVKNYSHSTEK
ncbi:MAG: hypothetical protein ACXWRZ_19135 [Bdellovibrio sp.]